MGCLLYPDGMSMVSGNVPEQTTEDLQLERLADFMSYSNYFKITAEELNDVWTEEPAVIAHRQAVLTDILKNTQLETALTMLLECIDGWEWRSGGFRRAPDSVGFGLNIEDFNHLDGYIKKLEAVYSAIKGIKVRSDGMKALFNKLESMRSSERFKQVKSDFDALCRGYVAPKRMRIGFNLDRELKASWFKLLYMEPYTGKKEKRNKNRGMWLTQRAMDMHMTLLRRSFQNICPAIGGFIMRETMELRSLKKDLIFFLSAKKLCCAWKEKGLNWCFPEIRPKEEKAFCAKGMYNPHLVVGGKDGKEIVTNDIEFSKGGEILILTGANQGGKTVFLLSVALTQWLFQLGIAVPCDSASLSPAFGIFTVFAPSDIQNRQYGLLAEEASRIAAAVNNVKENSMVLFNEPLTSTSPSETKSISLEVIAAFKAAGMRGVWVTHIHELASDREKTEQAIPWGSRLGSIKVLMDKEGDESRVTYKIQRAEPDFKSYASEVLRRQGITFQIRN